MLTASYGLDGPGLDYVKVKVTLVQALRLCTGRTAHRGSRGLALLFHDHGNRRGWGVRVTPGPLFTLGKDSIPIVQEAGWAPGPVWTGTENLATTGFQSQDRPARRQSLYRLRYPAHGLDYVTYCSSDFPQTQWNAETKISHELYFQICFQNVIHPRSLTCFGIT